MCAYAGDQEAAYCLFAVVCVYGCRSDGRILRRQVRSALIAVSVHIAVTFEPRVSVLLTTVRKCSMILKCFRNGVTVRVELACTTTLNVHNHHLFTIVCAHGITFCFTATRRHRADIMRVRT
jgi:hypothetical protein